MSAGDLREVRVPEPEQEQLRDLVRSRENLRVDLTRCRNRIGKFLLRREIHYPHDGQTWGTAHRSWLRSVRFDDRATELAFEDALHAHDSMLARRDQLELALTEIAETSAQATTISRLRCLRGIDTLTAVGLAAEVGEFGRFTHPRLLASYLGMVPSEQSSGEHCWQGAITRAGSKHARRLLVEAAWQYRYPPRVSYSRAGSEDMIPASLTLPGELNVGCTSAGCGSTNNAANAALSSRSPWPGSLPPSAGRSRP